MKTMFILFFIGILLGTGIFTNGQNAGDPAPDFTFKDLSGEDITLSEKTGKVVMLFLFGNTCPFCIAAGPKVEADIYEQFKNNEHFEAYGLDLWNGSGSQVESFMSKAGISFPLLLDAGSVSTLYKTTYDRIIVIDSKGNIKHKGSTSASNDISNAVNAITEALDEVQVTSASIIQKSQNNRMNVFPNPASSKLHFKANLLSGNLSIQILNLNGKTIQVLENEYRESGLYENAFDISHLKTGIYLISFSNAGNRFVQKISVL